MMGEVFRFGIVGTLGFIVDSAALLLFVAAGAAPLGGRIASFMLAATCTFALNHHYTFRAKGRPTLQSWSSYLGLTALGALINLGVYYFWISQAPPTPMLLLVGTALGSVTAMCVNYTLSRLLVFGRGRDRPVIGKA